MDPDLPVLERMEEVLGVILIGKRSAVLLETADNLDTLLFGQEGRTEEQLASDVMSDDAGAKERDLLTCPDNPQ